MLINVRIQHPADIQIKAWGLLTLIKQAGFLELTGPGISGNKRLLFSPRCSAPVVQIPLFRPRITGADRGSLCDLSKGFCWGGLLLRILTLPEFSDDDAVTAAGSAGAATDPAGSRR